MAKNIVVLKLYKMPKEERRNMGLKGRSYFFENFERELLLNKLEMIMENLTLQA